MWESALDRAQEQVDDDDQDPVAWMNLGSALVAVSINFLLARRIVGTPLKQISHPRLKQLLDHLDRNPVRNVILLRSIFNANAVLNHALALSPLSFRHYFLGSALGMILPMVFITALVGTIF